MSYTVILTVTDYSAQSLNFKSFSFYILFVAKYSVIQLYPQT